LAATAGIFKQSTAAANKYNHVTIAYFIKQRSEAAKFSKVGNSALNGQEALTASQMQAVLGGSQGQNGFSQGGNSIMQMGANTLAL
jgi:exo-beta-1,3-glucanase (GH17 family)